MHADRHYSLGEVIAWTRRETFVFLILATVPTLLYLLAGWRWLGLPWLPVATLGTAVAFLLGFRNSASYARLWEARQVWGSITNTSRAWAVLVLEAVPDAATRRRLFHRHFAWLTALRYQLRERRVWEGMQLAHNVEYQRRYQVPEWDGQLEAHLATYVDAADLAYVLARKNRALHLLHLQGRRLDGLTELTQLELHRHVTNLIDAQGRCERIKNFPYPRQYATLNHVFAWLFILLVPFALIPEFAKFGPGFVWLTIPVSTMLAWVFHTMDKIGATSENPFEGSPNDVPISALSRTIEIDLREMLGDTDLPPALPPQNRILM